MMWHGGTSGKAWAETPLQGVMNVDERRGAACANFPFNVETHGALRNRPTGAAGRWRRFSHNGAEDVTKKHEKLLYLLLILPQSIPQTRLCSNPLLYQSLSTASIKCFSLLFNTSCLASPRCSGSNTPIWSSLWRTNWSVQITALTKITCKISLSLDSIIIRSDVFLLIKVQIQCQNKRH